MDVLQRYREFVIGVVSVVVFMVLLVLLGAAVVEHRGHGFTPQTAAAMGETWPGKPDICVTEQEVPNCYREPVVKDAIVKQPVSSASALALTVAGLFLLWRVGWDRSTGRRGANPIANDPFYKTALGLVGVLMGPGSILFHATLTAWGGMFDQYSMYLLLGFMVSYNLIRLARPEADHMVFLLMFAGISAAGLVIAGLAVTDIIPAGASTGIFIGCGVAVGIFEVVVFIWLRFNGWERDHLRFWLGALGTLATAIAFWLVSNEDMGPPTDFPWHLFWHVLSGVFILAYYCHLRSEKPKTA